MPDTKPSSNGDGKAADHWRLSPFAETSIRRVLSACPCAILTFLAILLHADWQTGIAYPSIATIGELVKRSKRNVLRDLEALQAAGVVEIVGKHKSTTGRPGNRYRLIPIANGDTTEPNHPMNGDTTEPKNGSLVPSVSEFGSLVAKLGDTREPEPYSRTILKNQRARKGESIYSVDFDAWWTAYPKKEAKRAAWKAYQDAVHRIAEQDSGDVVAAKAKLLDRAKAFALTPKGQAGRYCPNAATWLNQDRFDDDPAAWQQGGETNGKPRQASAGSTYDETANYSSLGER